MNKNGSDIVCYWGSGSAPSWRVLICIHEKQLTKATLELLSMSDKEHKEERILKLNPRGQVPTFKDGNVVINESLAICDYLAETYKGQGTELIPSDTIEKGLMRQRTHELQNLYGKVITLSRYYWKRKPYYTQDIVQTKIEDLSTEIKLWESYISNGYLVGNQFTLADACFFPVVAFMVRLGFDITQCNNLNEFYKINAKRESIVTTWPPHWKDSKNKTIFKSLIL